MAAIKPRYYQTDAVKAINNYLWSSTGHGLVVIGTAGGKSYTICDFIKQQIDAISDLRILVLTHVKELIEQNYKSIIRFWRGAPATIYSAGLGQRNGRGQIVFAGIQSVYDKAHRIGDFDIVLIDEAHLIPRESQTQYGRLIADLMARTPHLRCFGFTATPWRLDSGHLCEGEPRLFDEIIYEKNIGDLIREGWCAMPVTKSARVQIDMKGVKKSGKDYNKEQMEAAADAITAEACLEAVQRATGRKRWLVFAAGVQHAYHVRDVLEELGVSCEVVHGDMEGDRGKVIERHKNGDFKALINVAILTTGYDDVEIDCIIMLRATASLTLWHQIVGRGVRPMWPEGFDANGDGVTDDDRLQAQADGPKPNFLLLDFGGNIQRHGPLDDPIIKGKTKKGDGSTPGTGAQKTCPTDGCETIVSVNTRTCPDCGHEWEYIAKPKHEASPDESEILRGAPKAPVSDTKWVAVEKILFELWRKPDKADTLRVSYSTDDMKSHSEWLSFEGDYGPSRSTKDFFCEAIPGAEIPATAREAMELLPQMRPITRIAVRKPKGSRYSEIRVRQAATVPDMPSVGYLCTECSTMLPVGDTCPCATGLKLPARKEWQPPIEHDWDDEIPF